MPSPNLVVARVYYSIIISASAHMLMDKWIIVLAAMRTISSSLLHFNSSTQKGPHECQALKQRFFLAATHGNPSWTLFHQLFVKMCFRHNRSNIIETNWSIMNEECHWENDSVLCRSLEKTSDVEEKGAGSQIKRINFFMKRFVHRLLEAQLRFYWKGSLARYSERATEKWWKYCTVVSAHNDNKSCRRSEKCVADSTRTVETESN